MYIFKKICYVYVLHIFVYNVNTCKYFQNIYYMCVVCVCVCERVCVCVCVCERVCVCVV